MTTGTINGVGDHISDAGLVVISGSGNLVAD
jgi:hypothetical protein